MPGKASVVFNADTGQYIANVQGMDAATAKAAQTVADAKTKILSSFKAQEAALKELGGSTEDFAKASTAASNALATVTEKNAQKQIDALERVNEKQKALKAELNTLGSLSVAPKLPESNSGHGFSDRMATSAVVRAGEGTTSIRAIETFITKIPGATAAAQGLANVIGAAGLIGIVAELGTKGYEAFESLSHSMRDATLAAEEMHGKSQLLIDDKEIENQKIQDQIAKISGKPNNGLATALLEGKKNADQLIASLKSVRTEMDGVFKEQKRGFAENALHALFNVGPEGTQQQTKELDQGNRDIESKAMGYRDNLDAGLEHATTNDDRKKLTEGFNAAVRKDVDNRIADLKKEYGRLGDEQRQREQDNAAAIRSGAMGVAPEKDNGLKQVNLQTDIRALRDFEKTQQVDTSIYDGQTKLGQGKQDKQNDHAGDEAARKADEATRKAAEAQRGQWQDQMDRGQLANPDWNNADTYLLRQDQQKTAQPANKIDAEKNLAEAYKAFLRSNAAEVKQITEAAQKAQREGWEQDYSDWESAGHRTAQAEADYWSIRMLEADQGSANYLEAERKANEALKRVREEAERAGDARNKAGVQQADNTARYAEATVALEEQTGKLSKYDAAVQLANIHTQQYAAQIAALKAELAKQGALDPNSAATVNAGAAVDRAETERAIQAQRDAANASGEAWKGALENANAEWVRNATDSAAQVKQLYTQAIDGFNENAANAMTGGKTNWSGYARGLGKTIATDGLKRAEAPLLGKLGIGKADGSESSPFYVKLADAAHGLGKLFGQSGSSGGSSDSSGGSGSLSSGIGQGLSGIAKIFSNSSSDGSDAGTTTDTSSGGGDSTGSAIGSAIGSLAQGFAGGFALGGDVDPGKTITVGEMGPEQMTLGPGTAAHVTPNKDLGNGGGHTFYNVSVGNGVTPEEFNVRMREALTAYHPQAVKASVQAMHDAQRRAPSTAR